MKFKEFVRKHVINNIGYKILAIVFAFVLWLVIDNIQDPEITRPITNIPVTILNEDMIPSGEYVYTIASGDSVSVSVKGSKSIVSTLSASDFIATADFAELSMTNAVPITVKLTGPMAKYENQLTITQKTMSMLLSLDSIGTKEYEIELRYEGEKPENMIIDDVVLKPSTLNITAPASILKQISRVEIVVNLADVEDGAAVRAVPVIYNLGGNIVEPSDEVIVDVSEVTASFAAGYTKKIPISANYSGTPANGYEVGGVTMSFDSVVIKGSLEALANAEKVRLPSTLLNVDGATSDVSVTVNLGAYVPDGTVIYDNNVNVIIRASIKKSEIPTEAETTEETTEPESEGGETKEPESDEAGEPEGEK